jgi:uncharacterized membrane protein
LENLEIGEKPLQPKAKGHPFYYDQISFEKTLREEGVDESTIGRIVKKQFNKAYTSEQLIEEFRKDEEILPVEDISSRFFKRKKKEEESMEALKQKQLTQRKQQILSRRFNIKRLNRKSQVFISDRFLKFHLLQSLVFYLVLFVVPSISVIDCQYGHSYISYIALAVFMISVFFIDVVNLRQHIKKELLKLNLKHFYGNQGKRKYLLNLALIYGSALSELFLTQLNLFDLYTDFAFITMVYKDPKLQVFFMLSMVSFVLTMLPKVYSYFLIGRILIDDHRKFRLDPLMGKR